MKLVELENDISNQSFHPNSLLSDENYTKPQILSKLDMLMNQILHRKDITDDEKWRMYKEVLCRYLHFTNKPDTSNTVHDANSYFHRNSIDITTHPIDFDRNSSDILTKPNDSSRDSIDMISQPTVREFFESAREKTTRPVLSLPDELSPQFLRSGRQRQRRIRANTSSKAMRGKKRKLDKATDITLLPKKNQRRSSSLPNNEFNIREFVIPLTRWES